MSSQKETPNLPSPFFSLNRLQELKVGLEELWQKSTRFCLDDLFNGRTERAIRDAGQHMIDGKTVDVATYHQHLRLMSDNANDELKGQHRFRFHQAPDNDQPRPLIILVGGNDENLVKPNPGDPPEMKFGSTYLFEQLRERNDCHVLQFCLGNELAHGNLAMHSEVAWQQIRVLVQDALHEQGVFAEMHVSDMRLCGYSYGAHVVKMLVEGKHKIDLHGLPVTASVSIDPIVFRSLRPRPLSSIIKASQRQLNIHQRTPVPFWKAEHHIRGGRVRPRHTKDSNVLLTKFNHIEMTGAHREDVRKEVYDPVLEFLMKEE